MKHQQLLARGFHRSRLGLAVSAVLLGQTLPAWASAQEYPLTPINGVGGTAHISQTHGVPVINIVKPNESGLSHNQYLEYNVGANGVLINNSLVDGTSVLGLPVSANPQFVDNRSASTILNEVTGVNRSNILGRQEIFGDKADYVLSNPNGLWINEGWIDLKPGATATLLVGAPEIDGGRLVAYDSRQIPGRGATLNIGTGGLRINGGGLQLIAPTIDKRGSTGAAGNLDIVIGRQRVDAATGDISSSDTRYRPVDANLVGAMSANRIRILTTQQGAGIRMPITQVTAREGIDISSAGNLHITARQVSPEKLVRGELNSTHGDISLAARGDMALQALSVKAANATVQAGQDLDLGTLAKVTESSNATQVENPWHFLPNGTTKTSTTRIEEQLFGTRIETRQQLALTAGRNMTLRAAELSAATDIRLDAGRDLHILGGVDETSETVDIKDRRPLASASDNLRRIDRHAVASTVKARGTVRASANELKVQASEINGDRVALEAKAGDVLIKGMGVTSELHNAQADKKLFITTKDLARDTRVTRYAGSTIAAANGVQISASGRLEVAGSKVAGGTGDTLLRATEGIELVGGLATSVTTLKGKDWKLSWFAEETRKAEDRRSGSMQWVAGAGVKREKLIDTKTSRWQQGSQISGNRVDLDGGDLIHSNGALLNSRADMHLKARSIELLSSSDSEVFSNSITGDSVGMQWTGGLTKVGSAAFAEHEVYTDGSDQQISTGTALVAGDNLTIDAGTLTNVGTQMLSENALSITADTVDNGEAIDIVSTQIDRSRTKGTVGASLDYSDIAGAIYKAVTSAEQSRFHQQNLDDNLAPWSVGVEIGVDHQERSTQALINRAQVSRITGGNVTVDVRNGILKDNATHYSSLKGITTIRAGEHIMKAVHDTVTTSLNRLEIETLARLEAFTPVDFGVKLAAAGYENDRTDVISTAVVGKIHGKQGVQIQLGTNGLYEAAEFSSEGTGPFRNGGDITVRAGGDLRFDQADDSHEFVDYTGEGKGSLKFAFGKTTGIAVGAAASGVNSNLQSRDTDARVGRFTTPGQVTLQAGGDLSMEGTHIGSLGQAVADIDASAGGMLKVSAAHGSKRQYGDVYKGWGNFKLGRTLGSNSTVELGGAFSIGQTDETEHSRTGANWYTGNGATLYSMSTEGAAISLEGVTIDARTIDMRADAGGIKLTAAMSTIDRDNREGGAGFGFGRVNSVNPLDDTGSVHARVKVKFDQLDSTTYANTQLNAWRSITVHTGADLTLEGAALHAGEISGQVGADLMVKSLQDDIRGSKLDLDVRAESSHNPLAMLKGVKALGGPFAKKTADSGPFSNSIPDKWSQHIRDADDRAAIRIDIDAARDVRSTAAQVSAVTAADTWGLTVAGHTTLVGATLGMPPGSPSLGDGEVTGQALSGNDFHLGGSLHVASGTLDLISQLYREVRKPTVEDSVFDLGLIKASYRNEDQLLPGRVERPDTAPRSLSAPAIEL